MLKKRILGFKTGVSAVFLEDILKHAADNFFL